MGNVSNRLIYVVEDNHDNRNYLEKTLAAHPSTFQLHFFTNGSELFVWLTHQLHGRLPDLILMDLDMPVMNGFDTLMLLRAMDEYRNIPVVIHTHDDRLDCINRAYELGCQAYILKSKHALPLGRMLGQHASQATA